MRVLVTGGAGFIGTVLCEKLLRRGCPVGVYDGFVSHFPDACSMNPWKQRLARIEQASAGLKEGATLYRGDTRNATEVYRAVAEFQPTHVVHLAAVSGAVPASRHSMEAVTCAVDGTATLMECLRGSKLERFVYISSSMVYGDWPEYGEVKEGYRKKPVDIYGAVKLAGESVVRGYGMQFGIPYTVVRPSAVYGPFDSNNRVVQVFIENARTGKPLTIVGGDSTLLDFTYVDDIADGIVLALTHDDARFGTFNMTYGRARSLGELVGVLKMHFPRLHVTRKPARPNTPRRGALDCSQARALLRFSPRFGLEEGIAEYLKREGLDGNAGRSVSHYS